MALAYLDLFADAVATYGALLADGGAPGPDDPRWTIRRRPTLPEPFSKPLQAAFGSTAYRCAMTWQPRVGRGLLDLVDPQLGINGWELRHPSVPWLSLRPPASPKMASACRCASKVAS